MPPKVRFTKEEVVTAAAEIVREHGMEALTARALGEKLDASAKPVFGLFGNMENVRTAVLEYAEGEYERYLHEDMTAGRYPPYKASGMAYIRFAREEKQLFRLLFMRDRTEEMKARPVGKGMPEEPELYALIQQNTGMSHEQARLFHLEMWVFVHGIASMLATSYLEWNEETVSLVLSDGYLGLVKRFQEAEGNGK